MTLYAEKNESKNLANELKSQPINLVGNAQSLFDSNYGEYIDLYPTVRFNTLKKLNVGCQGTRWDYLASSNIKTIEYYNNNKPQFHTFLFTMYQDWHIKNLDSIKFDASTYTIDYDSTVELRERLNTQFPSTGMTVLYYLHKIQHPSVNIFGFDWKATNTFYNRKEKKLDPHNYIAERDLCWELIKHNNWNYH